MLFGTRESFLIEIESGKCNIVFMRQRGHHLSGVRHGGHTIRSHEGGNFNLLEPGVHKRVNQSEL
jgi:hypothetical protein